MEDIRNFDPRSVLNAIYNGIVAIDEKVLSPISIKLQKGFLTFLLMRLLIDISWMSFRIQVVNCSNALKTGTPFYGEKLKGEKVTLISNINPIVSNGKISGVVSIFQDISEIERISKELDLFKNMKNWLDTIIDSSYDGLWICDHEGKVIRINKASERINDVKAEEVVGKNMKELIAEGLFDKSVTLEVLKRRLR